MCTITNVSYTTMSGNYENTDIDSERLMEAACREAELLSDEIAQRYPGASIDIRAQNASGVRPRTDGIICDADDYCEHDLSEIETLIDQVCDQVIAELTQEGS